MTRLPPICRYCRAPARLVDSKEIYGRSYGMIWLCSNYPDCDAYVGCHNGTHEPLGILANPKLRAAKKRAHAAFDPLWKEAPAMYDDLPDDSTPAGAKLRRKQEHRIRQRARKRAYQWLAEQLGISANDCHIGFFDLDQCERVVSVCCRATTWDVRAWAKQQAANETRETP